MKVLNLGLPKSGTTTLHTALNKAGLKSAHWEVKPRRWNRLAQTQYVGVSIYKNYLDGRDPLAGLAGFDAVTQADLIVPPLSLWPQMDRSLLYRIREFHPDCLFLLLTRNPAQVADSIARWGDLHRRLVQMGAPGLGSKMAGSKSGLRDWISQHNAQIRDDFGKDPNFLELEVTDADGQGKLSERMGFKLPWWGVANTNLSGSEGPVFLGGEDDTI